MRGDGLATEGLAEAYNIAQFLGRLEDGGSRGAMRIARDDVLVIDEASQVGPELRRRYRDRLIEGHGYDDEHRHVLAELQHQQAQQRNRPGGYWIAEADPSAADHAIVTRSPADRLNWAILATDGAYRTMTHLGNVDWAELRNASSEDLAAILEQQCQHWETTEDPRGQKLPRAEIYDDKSIAAVTFTD